MTWHSVIEANALRNDEAVPVKVADRDIALCSLGGEYYAIGNICTHQHAFLTDGFVEDGCIECPLHQGRFDIKTGRALGPPATLPVPTYPVKMENGKVLVYVV